MNAPCPFDAEQLTFTGLPLEQARCLLRFVKRAGGVDDTPAKLPQSLADLLSNPLDLGITKTRLRSYLQKQGIPESTVGGSVTDRLCHADDDNPSAPLARYFVIHDTCACRKLNPGISVMESTQDWATKNVAGAIDGARDRCIFLQR